MVVQRTLNKIEELKDRPHHERRIIARYWAIGVAAALIVVWGFFAVRGIGRTAIELTRLQNTPKVAPQTASAAEAANSVMLGAPPELTASSTNGHVDLVPVGQKQGAN